MAGARACAATATRTRRWPRQSGGSSRAPSRTRSVLHVVGVRLHLATQLVHRRFAALNRLEPRDQVPRRLHPSDPVDLLPPAERDHRRHGPDPQRPCEILLFIDVDLEGDRVVGEPGDDLRVDPRDLVHCLAGLAPRRCRIEHEQLARQVRSRQSLLVTVRSEDGRTRHVVDSSPRIRRSSLPLVRLRGHRVSTRCDVGRVHSTARAPVPSARRTPSL